MKILNSRVLITGSNRGIGQAFAKAFAKEQCQLILVQRNDSESQIDELKKLGAKSIQVIKCDLSKNDEIKKLTTQLQTLSSENSVDIFVNNAGVLTGELLENQTDEEIINVFQVNLTAGILLTKALLPQMLKKSSGLIVSNCSVSSYMRFPCASTYSAAKAGLLAFTECLEVELSGTGVKTLSLITPAIKTDMLDALDKSYGKYFEVPSFSISADDYAKKVIRAIQSDKTYLIPSGLERAGLFISKYTPQLFKSVVVGKFSRK
jgi:hypothetical protein